jgi:hypothetical protein
MITKTFSNIQDNQWRWIAFSVISLAVFLVYYPSLSFPPRSDHIAYLAGIANIHSPWELLTQTYDINRHNVFWGAADNGLFRPLLFLLYAVEQIVFGYHFWGWQLVGILMHLGVGWIMLRILWRLSNGWLAFAGTWLFALSIVGFEMVTWTQIMGYMFMIIFVLLALEQVVVCLENQNLSRSSMIKMTVYFGIACFSYETANIFAIWTMGILMLIFSRQWKLCMMLIIPVISYVVLSWVNYACINHLQPNGTVLSINSLIKSIPYIPLVGLWWFYEGLFNGIYSYAIIDRTVFSEDGLMIFKPLTAHPQVIYALLMVLALGSMGWINRLLSGHRQKILVVFVGMLALYVSVIVLGRQITSATFYKIQINIYYQYLFEVIVFLIAFLFLEKKEEPKGWYRWAIILFVVAALASGISQGKRIYDASKLYRFISQDTVLLTETLDRLIKEKGHLEGFSFYVDPKYPGNIPYSPLNGMANSYAQLLFPQYIRPLESAKYQLMPTVPADKYYFIYLSPKESHISLLTNQIYGQSDK